MNAVLKPLAFGLRYNNSSNINKGVWTLT